MTSAPDETRDSTHVALDEEWSLWRTFVVRATGFPLAGVLDLGAPAALAAAERLQEAEIEERDLRSRAIEALWGEHSASTEERRTAVNKALKQLQKGRPPDGFEAGPGAAPSIESYRAARSRVEAARESLRQCFGDEMRRIQASIQSIAADPRFREAVIWQNRSVVHAALAPVDQGTAMGSSKARQREQLVVKYWQRYCVKNDTIGFFGPVGWGTITGIEPISVRPGPNLLAQRTVYFERWGIVALAKELSKDQEIRVCLPPRLHPAVRLDGRMLHHPSGEPAELPPERALLLSLCDGRASARSIARAVAEHPESGFRVESDVLELLDQLATLGVVIWEIELVPSSHVEQSLLQAIARIEDPSIRRRASSVLEEVLSARDSVSAAVGNVSALDDAMARIESAFMRSTGGSPTRAHGRAYAGRQLVYEDCRRDLELEVSPEILARLRPALTMLLRSARWFSYEVALRIRASVAAIHSELAGPAGHEVQAGALWARIAPLLRSDEVAPAVLSVRSLLQEKWARILAFSPGDRRVAFSAADLSTRVIEEFNAPSPGWSLARYHAPDVLIASSSVDAIRRGDYQFVLGELHQTFHTFLWALFVDQHRDPGQIGLAFERDHLPPSLVPMAATTQRGRIAIKSSRDVSMEFLAGNHDPGALRIGDLSAVASDRGIVIRSRDGRHQWDVIEALGFALSEACVREFQILGPASHTPRVVVDDVVICRESWSFEPAEIAFATEPVGLARFERARRWAREHSIPRFVFVKLTSEKPIFVDLASPPLIDLFAHEVRSTSVRFPGARVAVTEMLPGPEGVWLPDIEGKRYCSEFRFIAVDAKAVDARAP